jgi:hypothetical protein
VLLNTGKKMNNFLFQTIFDSKVSTIVLEAAMAASTLTIPTTPALLQPLLP